MAPTNLPVFIHTGFQQAMDSWFAREIARVDRVMAAHSLGSCQFEDDRYEFPCGKPATVSDLDSERDLCARHFEEVS